MIYLSGLCPAFHHTTQVAGTAEWVKEKAAGVWGLVVESTAAHKTGEGLSSVKDKVGVCVC